MSKKKKSAGHDFKPRPTPKTSSGKKDLYVSLFIFSFAFLLYANTLGYGYVLDDDVVYLKNRIVQEGIGGIKDIFTHSFIYGFTGHNDQSYRPMVQAVYAIEKTFLGNNPHAQHFINVLLFALSCLLLYKLLQKMFRNFSLQTFSILNFQFSLPLVITLFFAAHPVHTEAVSNIKGLDDILNFLFLILSLLFIFRYYAPSPSERARVRPLFFSILFFFLSLLCKEMAVTFLVIIPMTVFFFTNTPLKKILTGTIPFLGAFVIYYLIRISVLDVATFEEKMKVMNNSLAAATNESDRIATAIFILGKYIQLLFFPHPLSWDYSYNQIPVVAFTDVKVIITLAVLALLVVFALIYLKKKSVFSYCILFFFITMSVVSNIFIMIGSTLGERFLFTPSLTFCIAVPLLLHRFGKSILLGAAGIILVLFSYKTFSRNKDWKDNFSLFSSGVEATPQSSRALCALGSAYREQAEKEQDMNKRSVLFQKAIGYYKKAIEILPDNTEALYNAGVSYYGTGDKDNALEVYMQALSVSPGYANAANNTGVIYFERKEYENAKKYFLQAVKYDANNGDALGNLGAINHNIGNMKEAVEYYKQSLKINPSNQNVQANLAKAEAAMNEKK